MEKCYLGGGGRVRQGGDGNDFPGRLDAPGEDNSGLRGRWKFPIQNWSTRGTVLLGNIVPLPAERGCLREQEQLLKQRPIFTNH